MNRDKGNWRDESQESGREASGDNKGGYRPERRTEGGNRPRPRFTGRREGGSRSDGRYERVGYSGRSENQGGNRYENRDSRGANRYDNRNESRGGNRYEGPNDNRYQNRDGNRYDNRSDNRGGNRYDNRSDNRYDNRGDSRGGNRFDNRNENRYGSRGGNRYDNRDNRGDNRPRREGAPGGDRGYAPRRQGGGYGGRDFNQGNRQDRRPRPGGNRGGGEFRRPVRRTPDYDPNAKYSKRKQVEYKQFQADPDELIRINRYLANAGICSRREADEFVAAGAVMVNGEVVTELGTKVKRSDEIKFNGELISIEKKVYVLLNKPKDCVTTMDDPRSRLTVMDLVKNACDERIYPVGRLDRRTTGVLLLTNDGDLASKLTHPRYEKKKVYHVFLDKNVTRADIEQIAEGIELEDGMIKADDVGYTDEGKKNQIGIEIHSGKNRIVRRIFESLGYRVVRLDRVLFAGLTKKGLRRGEWRYLTEKEVGFLKMGSF